MTDRTSRSRVTTGVALIAVGLGLYGLRYVGEVGESVVLMALGALCIGGYLYGRSAFLLVAGGVLLGSIGKGRSRGRERSE